MQTGTDDTDPDINPGATEAWDGIDNDCSGIVDDINEADAGILIEGVGDDFLGWQAALSTGDVTGDGQVDLLVGGNYVLSYGTGGVHVIDGDDFSDWSGTAEDLARSSIDGAGSYGYLGTMGSTMGDQNETGQTTSSPSAPTATMATTTRPMRVRCSSAGTGPSTATWTRTTRTCSSPERSPATGT